MLEAVITDEYGYHYAQMATHDASGWPVTPFAATHNVGGQAVHRGIATHDKHGKAATAMAATHNSAGVAVHVTVATHDAKGKAVPQTAA